MGKDVPISPGDIVLNKYRVERILGKGGMGIVVAAHHIELDEMFAIKLMLPAIAENREAVERFLREARAAAKLKGDHVAKVHDVGRLPDGTSYMVMEYLTGSDLKEVVRKQGPLPVDEAVTYVLQACETLREAHALGIVHRDIKPANIFLARGPNNAPRVKVIDFGISKTTTGDAVGLTATATVGGSPLYMSPEQMRSAKYVDHRTDIWAIGIVLYELVTGTTPFKADTITAVAGRVLQDEPVVPSHLRAEVPTWIDNVVLHCLAKQPDKRFQSIDEVMEGLRAGAPGATRPVPAASDGSTVPLGTGRVAAIPHGSAPADTAPLPVGKAATLPATTPASSATTSTTGGFGQAANLPALTAGETRSRKRRHLGVVSLIGVTIASCTAFFLWFGLRAGAPVAAGDGLSRVPQAPPGTATSTAPDLPLSTTNSSVSGGAKAPPTATGVPATTTLSAPSTIQTSAGSAPSAANPVIPVKAPSPVATGHVYSQPPSVSPGAHPTSTATAKPAATPTAKSLLGQD